MKKLTAEEMLIDIATKLDCGIEDADFRTIIDNLTDEQLIDYIKAYALQEVKKLQNEYDKLSEAHQALLRLC